MNFSRFKATQSWQRSYSPALSVEEEECVSVGNRDTQWPDWIWCRNSSGLGGWLPEAILSSWEAGDTAVVLQAFDTGELTVSPDELLEGIKARDGWVWCRNCLGTEGWVPSDHLKPVSQEESE